MQEKTKSVSDSGVTKIKGTHIISLCRVTTEKAFEIQSMIENCRLKRELLIKNGVATRKLLRDIWREYNFWLEELHKKYLLKQFYVENITTTVGRSVLAQRLGGDTTYTGVVNYGAIGTDNTAAAIGDNTLGAETYRKALSSGTDSANQAFLENFYTASEVSGTFEEFGFFIDGTGSADSGQLFNRFTQNVVKANTESLNVQSTVTFNDA